MSKVKTIGLVMIVKNESRCLEKSLSQAKKLADKIFITDTGSTDHTIQIAEAFDVHISHFDWRNDFAAARNYALEQSDCDWNLVIDADEYLISGEKQDILSFIENGDRLGAIQRYDSYPEGNGEISTSRTLTTRLLPRGTRYTGRVHEQIVSSLPRATLPLIFEHDGYMHENKGERNAAILQDQLKDDPTNPYTLYQLAHTLRLLKRSAEANACFEDFYRLVPVSGTGYRTKGILSYLYNLMELRDYEKGLQIIHNEKQRLGNYTDYHFACGIFYMKMILFDIQRYISYLPEIEKSFLNCLRIGEVPEHEGVVGCGSFKAAYNLGVWYEVSGDLPKAEVCYHEAAATGYAPAVNRLTRWERKEKS